MAKAPQKAAVKADGARYTYPVLGALLCDGETFDAGDTIEMTAKEAQPLIDGGTLGAALAAVNAPA
ncbi:hypothetical protein [Methylocystis sp. S23]